MKRLTAIGMLVITAVALIAIPGSASATPIYTSPPGTDYTGEAHATLVGSWTLKASVFTATCTAATEVWDIDLNETNHAQGKVTKKSFSSCDSTVDVLSEGSISVEEGGVLTGSGTTFTVEKFGVTCIYGTGSGTKLGTVTPGSPAEVTENASLPRQEGSGGLCAAMATETDTHKITSPTSIVEDH